jgi:hypothetical protein
MNWFSNDGAVVVLIDGSPLSEAHICGVRALTYDTWPARRRSAAVLAEGMSSKTTYL